MTTTDDHLYLIVRNDEEQYSIWRADEEVPPGWDSIGGPDTRSACLDRIGEMWSDMRPASLRAFMEGESERTDDTGE